MWDLHFFNPPKQHDMLYFEGFFESDRMREIPEGYDNFLYIITEDKAISGGVPVYNNEGYLVKLYVNDNMDITPFCKALFEKYGTVSVDESVYEDAMYFENMTQEEIDLMWDFLFLSQMLARRIVKIDDEWSKNILAKVLDYMRILDKYDLFFTPVNFFAPSPKAIKKLEENLEARKRRLKDMPEE